MIERDHNTYLSVTQAEALLTLWLDRDAGLPAPTCETLAAKIGCTVQSACDRLCILSAKGCLQTEDDGTRRITDWGLCLLRLRYPAHGIEIVPSSRFNDAVTAPTCEDVDTPPDWTLIDFAELAKGTL